MAQVNEPVPRPKPTTSGKAIASLVLGLLSFGVPIVLAIPAILLAILGLRDIRRSQGRLVGRRLAIAGIVTSLVGNLIFGLAVVFGLLPAVRAVASEEHSALHLHTIALAMLDYHDTYRTFPPAVVSNKDGQKMHSWRVLLLPFLNQKSLYEQYRFDEPWDSPRNQALMAKMPREYAPSGESFPPQDLATHCLVFTGRDAPFDSGEPPPWLGNPMHDLRSWELYFEKPVRPPLYCFGKRPTIAAFSDGLSNTILLVEGDERVPWTKPQDLPYAADQPLPKLGGLHRHGFLVAMADGSVRKVSDKTSEKTFRAAITPNGGEILGPDWDHP